MPAYSVDLEVHICYNERCGRRATKKVYNSSNELVGYYCARHDKPVVDRMNK